MKNIKQERKFINDSPLASNFQRRVMQQQNKKVLDVRQKQDCMPFVLTPHSRKFQMKNAKTTNKNEILDCWTGNFKFK